MGWKSQGLSLETEKVSLVRNFIWWVLALDCVGRTSCSVSVKARTAKLC